MTQQEEERKTKRREAQQTTLRHQVLKRSDKQKPGPNLGLGRQLKQKIANYLYEFEELKQKN